MLSLSGVNFSRATNQKRCSGAQCRRRLAGNHHPLGEGAAGEVPKTAGGDGAEHRCAPQPHLRPPGRQGAQQRAHQQRVGWSIRLHVASLLELGCVPSSSTHLACVGARSVAASHKPPMLVTRVRLPARALVIKRRERERTKENLRSPRGSRGVQIALLGFAPSLRWGLSPGPSVYKTDARPLSYRGGGSACRA